MYVATLEPTEVTVTVALFAAVAPPKFAPTTVTVSLTLKPVPAAFIAAVYVPFVFVMSNFVFFLKISLFLYKLRFQQLIHQLF